MQSWLIYSNPSLFLEVHIKFYIFHDPFRKISISQNWSPAFQGKKEVKKVQKNKKQQKYLYRYYEMQNSQIQNWNRKFLCFSFHTVTLVFAGFSVPFSSHKYLKSLNICTYLGKKILKNPKPNPTITSSQTNKKDLTFHW